MMLALVIAAQLASDVKVALPVTCSYTHTDLHGNPVSVTVAAWRGFKNGANVNSKQGPWIGSSFTCADFGITKKMYDAVDYFLFYADQGAGPMPMCIPGRPCPCTILIYVTDGRTLHNACP